MRFAVLLYQEGGCDYTIGCGRNWEFFDAPTLEAAKIKAQTIWNGHSNPDSQIKEVTLLQVSEVLEMDVPAWEAEREQDIVERKRKVQEREDQEEFERLKKKLGKK